MHLKAKVTNSLLQLCSKHSATKLLINKKEKHLTCLLSLRRAWAHWFVLSYWLPPQTAAKWRGLTVYFVSVLLSRYAWWFLPTKAALFYHKTFIQKQSLKTNKSLNNTKHHKQRYLISCIFHLHATQRSKTLRKLNITCNNLSYAAMHKFCACSNNSYQKHWQLKRYHETRYIKTIHLKIS